MEVAEKNKKAFVELLFWKTNKEAIEVVEGYGSYQTYVIFYFGFEKGNFDILVVEMSILILLVLTLFQKNFSHVILIHHYCIFISTARLNTCKY